MKAAVLTEYNQPMVVEDITLGELGPRSVHVRVDASGVCHSDLSAAQGKVPMGVADHPRPRGRRHRARGRLRGAPGEARRHGDRFVRAGVRPLLLLPPRPVAAVRAAWASRPGKSKGTPRRRLRRSGDDRARHLRRGDDHRRGDGREGRDRPAGRAARAHRVRRHHRRRRGAEHRADRARVDRHRDRLRRRRPVGDPGRPHRRRVAHLRRRPGRDEAQDCRAVRRHRPRRPGRGRPGRAGEGCHPGPRHRLRVRGDRPPRDDPAGLQHRPAGRHRRGGRHAAPGTRR